MTIQISVLIWTVISFVLLMIVLRNLLFKPVLELMDSRRERIKKAAEKKSELEKLTQEQEILYLQKKEAAFKDHKKQVKGMVEEIRSQSKRDIDEARTARLKRIDSYHAEVEAQQRSILSDFTAKSYEIAFCFADSLIKR